MTPDRSTPTRTTAVGLLCALALLLAACGGDDGNGATGPGDGDGDGGTDIAMGDCPADSGGSFRMGMVSQPAGLDPIATTGSGTTGGNELLAVYDTLMQYDPDTNTYEPHVAEALDANDAFDEWTVTLRDGVTFGNGDPLDAAAVIASLERYQGEENTGPYRNLALFVEEMEEVDDLTVRFTLNRAWASFPFLLANGPGMIVNTALADEAGDAFGTDPTGAGVGPFEVDRFVTGEEIVLQAKDDYWAGELCIDELVFQAMPEDGTRWDAFRNSEVDAAFVRDPAIMAEADDAGYGSLSNLASSGNIVLLNVDGAGDPATADVRLRQAIAHAIDVDAIDARVNEGTGFPAKTVVADESAFGGDLEALATDADAAGSLIDEVLSDGDWDGTVTLTCDRNREDLALTLEAQLTAAGFEVDLDLTPSLNELLDAVIVNNDFELACWGLNVLDSGVWPTMNSSLYSTSPSNYGGYADETMDAALDELSLAETPEEIANALGPIQDAWNETVPAVPLEAIYTTIVHQDHAEGLRLNNNSLVFFDRVRLSS